MSDDWTGASDHRGRSAEYWGSAALLLLAAAIVAIVLPDRSYLCFTCRGRFPPRLPNHRVSLRVTIVLAGALLAGATVVLGSAWVRALLIGRRLLFAGAMLVLVATVAAAISIPSRHFCPSWSCPYGASAFDRHLLVRIAIAAGGAAIAALLVLAAGPLDRRRALGAALAVFVLALSVAFFLPTSYSCPPGDSLGYISSNGGPTQVGCGPRQPPGPIQGSWVPGDVVRIDYRVPARAGFVMVGAGLAVAAAVGGFRKKDHPFAGRRQPREPA